MLMSNRCACTVLALLLACTPCREVLGRELGAAPPASSQESTNSLEAIKDNNFQSSGQTEHAAARQQRAGMDSRRLMQNSNPALVEAAGNVPIVKTSHFTKIAMNISRPLGTALNGSAYMPGPCGPHPSALGYQCSWVAPGGAVLHWTYSSTSSAPPINRCTAQPQAVPNLEIQEFNAPVVHFALQAATKEKLHLSFIDPEARLFPSEGVHGHAVDPCKKPFSDCTVTSTPQVEVLYHSSPGSFWSTGRISTRDSELMEGWAGWVSADTEGQSQVICLSRHVQTKLMKLGPQTKPELLVAYAVGDAGNYMAYGQQKGMVSVDLITGKATKVESPTSVLLAHAILMLVAFGVLLPMGLLLARHKWLFVDEEQGLSPWWGLSHFVLLLLCGLVGLTGMVVALVRFGNTITGLVMSTHQVLGLLSVGLSLVLAVMYGLRPFLVAGQKHAPSPLLGPQKVGGIVTIAAGWTSVFLGCVVIHQTWAVPYLTWLLPCIMIIALVACAAILLELRYQKLIRTGAYNPKTCTLSNAGPSIPLARVRTHREPTNFKKQEQDSVFEVQGHSPMITAHHGDAAVAGNVAATILARSIGVGQLKDGDNTPGSRNTSSAGSGRGSSAGGAIGELFRRARHSTPNAVAAQVQTGFPSSPGNRPYSNDAA